MTLLKNKKTLLLILLAFIFSFSMRLIWVYQFSDSPQFKFNDEFMINTNDGYFYAEGTRDILAGKVENTNDLSPFKSAVSNFTAAVVKAVPFSLETVLFYMPAFFASLLVIPIILISKEFEKVEAGFIAALIGSIAWSYYNRTMVGYYDTDFLNIVFPTVLLWSLIWAIRTGEEKYLLLAGLDSIAYRWWYPQSYSLEFAFIALIGLYIIYQYFKKVEFKTNLLLVTFMLFAMVNIDSLMRFIIIICFYFILKIKKELVFKNIYFIFFSALFVFFITGGFDPIMSQLNGYVFRESFVSTNSELKLHFFTVMQTIREAGAISFETFANRISGHTVTFIVSLIGYIWMSIKFPVMLLALPMLGLGFLAYGIPGLVNGGGLRFTIYAVPVLALGFGYFVCEISLWISKQFIEGMARKISKYFFMILFTLLGLAPNIQHIIEYKVPTVFVTQEVEALNKLKSIASREDYVVAWWDYGYPLRYYSDVKTLIDGGKHSGSVNFPVSYILNSSQDKSAIMARLDVEYTEKRFNSRDDNLSIMASTNIEQMLKDYSAKSANDFLNKLNKDLVLPKKTRDIYLYLPNRMMTILPTISLFSNINLDNGRKPREIYFYHSSRFKENGNIIHLGNNINIIKNAGQLSIGQQKVSINNFVVTQYNNKGKLEKKIQKVNKNGLLNVIFMKDYNQFIVLDNNIFNSLYIQLFVLENYDPNLYQPVILSPLSKIYKLKI